MPRVGLTLAGLTSLLVSLAAAAQDRSACTGIYCPQVRASDSADELEAFTMAGKTWEQVRGRNTLVLKYYHRDGTLASIRTWPQIDYMKPVGGMSGKIVFAGQGTPTIALYGLAPCARKGSFNFSGQSFTCDSLWRSRLADNLYGTQVVLCRAYADQASRPVQEATCLVAEEGVGGRTVGGVVVDDVLVGIGAAALDRDASGKPLRPELVGAEKTGAAILAGGGR